MNLSTLLDRWNDALRSLRNQPEQSPGPEHGDANGSDHHPDPGQTRAHYGRSAAWTAIGTYLPGAGLLKGGRRMLFGTIALGLFTIVVLLFGIWALVDLNGILKLGVNLPFLKVLVVAIPLVTLGWLWLIVSTHQDLRPRLLTSTQRGLSTALVTVLCLTISAPMAVAARYSFDQARLLQAVFKNGDDIKSGTAPETDAWRNKPRVSFLLLGGDAGEDRYGTRTDTMILATVDTHTGNTVLVSIPRNAANAPFPADSPLSEYYPDGFSSGWPEDPEHMFNNIYDGVPDNVPADILGPTDNLGADALKLAVGEATGVPVDYYMLVDLEGFSELINALGGVTVNINTWVAMGGDTDAGIPPSNWLAPGPEQHLNGTEALWFARGRYGADDYQRMDRQRCVIDAVIKQANPANVLSRYEDVARQSKDILQTDMPKEVLPALVDLGMRVKDGERDSIVLRSGEDGFNSSYPDWNLVRARVDRAIEEQGPKETPTPEPEPPGEPAPPEGPAPEEPAPEPTPTPEPEPTQEEPPPAEESPMPPVAPPEDLSSSCEFQPEVAAAQPPEPPL